MKKQHPVTKTRRTRWGANWENQFSEERRPWGFLNRKSLPGIKARGSRTSGELWITLQSWETRWNEILPRSLRNQQPFNARLLPSSILSILFISGFSFNFSSSLPSLSYLPALTRLHRDAAGSKQQGQRRSGPVRRQSLNKATKAFLSTTKNMWRINQIIIIQRNTNIRIITKP